MLSEVASLHRNGEYNGLWELKDNFKEDEDGVSCCFFLSDCSGSVLMGLQVRGRDFLRTAGDYGVIPKMEEVGDDEDDEDDDMEEVS